MANLLTISPFSCFSDEVLCLIFEFITSTYDLKNIMLACRRFHNLIRKRNKLWKLRLNVEKEVLDTLVSISSLSFPNGKPPLKVMDNFIVGKHPLELFEDEISKHLFHPQSKENLTFKFYAEKLLEHTRIHIAKRMWKQVDSLLHGAVLISQWGLMEEQYLISYDDVVQVLENITDRVRQIIAEESLNPDTSTDKNKTAMEMLNVINQVLYKELGLQKYVLHKNSVNFATVMFCIEKVLEMRVGVPLILAIIYYEVAKRMGILCELVYSPKIFRSFKEFSSTPHSFLLRWNEFSEDDDLNCTYYYNDPCNGGASHRPPGNYSTVPVKNVCMGLVENLLSVNVLDWQNQLHFYRLACIIDPNQASLVQKYAKLSKLHGEQLEEAIQLLKKVDGFMNNQAIQSLIRDCSAKLNKAQAQNAKEKENIKRRFPLVKYAVGLIMMHKKINVNGLQMDRLVVIHAWYYRPRQPVIYNVLFNNGNICDVKEGELELHPAPAAIKHPEIGKYFERFDGRRYIPNAEMKVQYPEDDSVALSLLQKGDESTNQAVCSIIQTKNRLLHMQVKIRLHSGAMINMRSGWNGELYHRGLISVISLTSYVIQHVIQHGNGLGYIGF
ncbi:F-box only protein 21-like isoform X4 [Daphnia pulex]|uniref:F-box only protein 21-like isoform X4 n=1 Tax=Daphnia pulex TaxID=6669 RepID=UPI001EE0FC65|nr:F-box only protein 21-like isoform X4 [Daphnia pulex]